jgi:hypothetical protein
MRLFQSRINKAERARERERETEKQSEIFERETSDEDPDVVVVAAAIQKAEPSLLLEQQTTTINIKTNLLHDTFV